MERKYAVLSAGELLADFISVEFAETFAEVGSYRRLMGGSPANMCMNMARLGHSTRLAASVGQDDMGKYLLDFVESAGVDCGSVARVAAPTTLILVTRSREVSNFEPYRGADILMSSAQFTDKVLSDSHIFHTTCFALSKNPAREAILDAAKRAIKFGCLPSIDANYANKIWPDDAEARRVLQEYLSNGAIIKMSEVDWERLYRSPMTDPGEAARFLHDMGASEVCLTMGSEGCYVSNGTEDHFLPSRPIEVKDTTGAGDAFWSGFLSAKTDGYNLLDCAKAGRNMAEIKLQHFGPLTEHVDKSRIYN